MSSPPPTGPAAFHHFEHAGWQRASAHYADTFGALTVQSTEPLLDAVGVASGTRLLDVASGPGYVAAAAAARGAEVVGLDFSALMLKRRAAGIRMSSFRKGTPKRCPSTAAASKRW